MSDYDDNDFDESISPSEAEADDAVPETVNEVNINESRMQRLDSNEGEKNDRSDDEEEDDDDDDDEIGNSENLSLEKEITREKKPLLPPEKLLRKAKKKSIRYTELKKNERAIRELIQCTALVRIIHGDQHWKLAESHVKLATAYFELKDYFAQAVYHCEIAENVLRNHSLPNNHDAESERFYSMYVELYHTLGLACMVDKKLNESETALAKGEKMFQKLSKVLSISHDDLEDWEAKLAIAMARLSFKQKKQAVSTMYYERAIKLLISQNGEDCNDLINIYQSLGKIEQSKGEHADHTKAIEYYLKAHSIASSKFSEESIEVADSSLALAQAYTRANDHFADNSAERYFGDSLAVYRATCGPTHEKTLAVQDELARLFIRTDRLEEGVSLLQSTISAKQDRYGDFSLEVAETWKMIGSCHLSTGAVEAALRAMKKCLAVETALYGEKSKKTKETQKTIDMLLVNPSISSKLKKSKTDELQQRPRFSSVVKSTKQLGGFRPQIAF